MTEFSSNMFSTKNLEYNNYDTLNTIHNINKKSKDNYTLMGYNKETITDDIYDYRSLIFYNKKLLAYCPPKTITFESFKDTYKTVDENIKIELFVEGTMIMLYYNDELNEWHTSTRGNIGATTSFFQNKSKKTFKDMFDEACNISFLDINDLDTSLCYIFVMNHPDNRIVTKCDIPSLSLVKVYKITNMEDNTFQVQVLEDISSMKSIIENTLIKYPNDIINNSKFTSENGSIDYKNIEDIIKTFDFTIMGIVIYNTKSDIRTKIRNQKYEYVRKLRGNQPKLDYRYLELKKNKNISKYLQYFPEHKDNFDEFWEKTKEFTNDLYTHYVDTHIKKTEKMENIPKEFRSHLYNLHQYYLNDLRPNKFTLQRTHVISYVNHLPEAMLLYALNYKKSQALKLSIKIPDVITEEFSSIPMAPRSKSRDFEDINTDVTC